jgi:hypothetical protein
MQRGPKRGALLLWLPLLLPLLLQWRRRWLLSGLVCAGAGAVKEAANAGSRPKSERSASVRRESGRRGEVVDVWAAIEGVVGAAVGAGVSCVVVCGVVFVCVSLLVGCVCGGMDGSISRLVSSVDRPSAAIESGGGAAHTHAPRYDHKRGRRRCGGDSDSVRAGGHVMCARPPTIFKHVTTTMTAAGRDRSHLPVADTLHASSSLSRWRLRFRESPVLVRVCACVCVCE